MFKCSVCGEPMPEGEEMFKFHGYSGPCPKPPLPRDNKIEDVKRLSPNDMKDVRDGLWMCPDGFMTGHALAPYIYTKRALLLEIDHLTAELERVRK